ncbi:Serine/threonine-protein kinase PknB [Maioricimonas rarisocia]|uniref:Serine/threonine-protein kinase PknB n=1 Tax=Maioricimonas rarisocia TaxID=2528026 RepID=A0A517Z3M7_9PLAN|nr:serine/threonine-protein kinase [Maioricimonas rarisocia]QDU37056.1 Serine/threonine-protein kinase PknB [Maioricimonas rarisocia]
MADNESIIDDYELVNCISTGNLSQIWEVKQVSSGQQLAMKLLLPEAFAEAEYKRALKQEAAIAKNLEHPNIIRVFDVVVNRKHAYFIMEYFRAANLKNMIRNDLTGTRVRARRMMECVSQALAAMQEQGLVHRDIKPDNILINKGSEVRLIDFSLTTKSAGALAKVLSSKRRTSIQGTRTYLAPEVIKREPTTFAADMYSLGITFYEVLTGRPPFISGNPNELLMMHIRETPEKPSGFHDNVTPEADNLVMRMLAKKPKDRPANMQELFAEVRSLKIFKSDPEEYARAKAEAAEATYKDSMAHRLDSRSDADRTPEEKEAAAGVAREKAKRKAEILAKSKKSAADSLKKPGDSKAPQQPAAAQPQQPPQQPMPPGYGMPGYPMPPMPGYPQMPPQMYPQQPYGMPPGYPPGQGGAPYPMPPGGMPPQQPGAPQQAPPQQPAPPAGGQQQPQQPPPQTPAQQPPQQPPQQQEVQKTPPKPAREEPQKKKPAKPKADPDEIPLMDELPDVF